MAKNGSPQEWQIARLEFAFFDARFARWTLYQKFNGSQVSVFSNSEEIHRSHIQQILASAESCLREVLDRIPENECSIAWVPSGENSDFYFCPCVLARHRQKRTIPLLETGWERILEHYAEVLDESGLDKRQIKPLARLLNESKGSIEEVMGKCPFRDSWKDDTCPHNHERGCACNLSLSFDEGLQLVSILPIQQQWDLFGYWSKRHSDEEYWSARLRFPDDSNGVSKSKRLLGYDVRIQLGKNGVEGVTSEGDFFDKLDFYPSNGAERSAYLAYAAFIDQLQPRLAPRLDGDSTTEYIIAYPIVVHGRTNLLQIRLVAKDTPDISVLHRFWTEMVHPELVDQNFASWITRMLEQVAVETFQFHVNQALMQSERIPVFSRKTLAGIFCDNVVHLLTTDEALIAESGEVWEYCEGAFGNKWGRSENHPHHTTLRSNIGLEDYGIEIKLSSQNKLDTTQAVQDYLKRFLLQPQWRWFERYAMDMVCSRKGISITSRHSQSSRFILARTALLAVGREIDSCKRNKSDGSGDAMLSRKEVVDALKALSSSIRRNRYKGEFNLSLLYDPILPSVDSWKCKEQKWSIADIYALPTREVLKGMPDFCLDVLNAAERALSLNWRVLMASSPRFLNHFGSKQSRLNDEDLQPLVEAVEDVVELDWKTESGSSVETVSNSDWFKELYSQLSGSKDFSGLDEMQAKWDQRLYSSISPSVNSDATWDSAPCFLDQLGHHRGSTPVFEPRALICQQAGIPMSDILLIHNVALANHRHGGPIQFVGWRRDENPKGYLSQVELVWKFSNRAESDPDSLYNLIKGKIDGITDEKSLRQEADRIEDIVKVVCYRYNGTFFLSTGSHYIKISCQGEKAVVERPQLLNVPEEAAYYCVLA
jgi:hypothetical protein